MKHTRAAVLLLLTLSLVLTGCLGPAGGGGGGRHHKLTVLAASSLTGAFGELTRSYQQHHKGKVELVLDSSATLVEQLKQGAPGGVLATADKQTMHEAVAQGLVQGRPALFATNVVELAVPADNPGHIHSFADLRKPGLTFLTCVPTAPCGASGLALLRHNHVTARPASQETDVKAVLAKVERGEADAGLVYRSDVVAAGDKVRGIPVPGASAAPNQYFIAVTTTATHPREARAWLKLVTGPTGRKALTRAGFGPAR